MSSEYSPTANSDAVFPKYVRAAIRCRMPASEPGDVEIEFEDFVFREIALDLNRREGFADLSGELVEDVFVGHLEVQVARQLLGDRTCALPVKIEGDDVLDERLDDPVTCNPSGCRTACPRWRQALE